MTNSVTKRHFKLFANANVAVHSRVMNFSLQKIGKCTLFFDIIEGLSRKCSLFKGLLDARNMKTTLPKYIFKKQFSPIIMFFE